MILIIKASQRNSFQHGVRIGFFATRCVVWIYVSLLLIFNRWLNPLFKIGHKRRLEEDDMYSVLPEDHSQPLGEELQGYWDQEVKRAEKDAREPSLMKAIINCYWKSYFFYIECIAVYMQISTEMDATGRERGQWFKSEQRIKCLGNMMWFYLWLYLSLEYKDT
ncbi:hypothetical protein FD755_015768 [Muntiacus reevesi]|uniref:Uncharacterized protein n=2 Tax=Muntiacus TaxID=9885 RepID=A0A5N3XKM4_MUNRE|nr:hypothetical protein FD754_024603 [Muntiacus muntjak]KAB0373015.1 hypothetical protein FD755_015768 [Muntiacus reevesi]